MLPNDPAPVEVVIVSGLSAMREEAAAGVPPWAVGVAQPQRGRIVVRADLLAEGYGGGLGPTLRHEWVHVAWGRHAGRNRRALPLWVEEGIAEEVGGGVSLDVGAVLDLAAGQDRLIPFPKLANSFPEDARDADLAYKQSRSWVRFLAKRKGWEAICRVLAATARGGDDAFADAVRAETGRGPDEWEAQWKVVVEEEARPWFHLLFADLGQTVLALGALLSLGLFVLLWRRRRRQIRALETLEVVVPGDEEERGGPR
jgi:hypothetical protein